MLNPEIEIPKGVSVRELKLMIEVEQLRNEVDSLLDQQITLHTLLVDAHERLVQNKKCLLEPYPIVALDNEKYQVVRDAEINGEVKTIRQIARDKLLARMLAVQKSEAMLKLNWPMPNSDFIPEGTYYD